MNRKRIAALLLSLLMLVMLLPATAAEDSADRSGRIGEPAAAMSEPSDTPYEEHRSVPQEYAMPEPGRRSDRTRKDAVTNADGTETTYTLSETVSATLKDGVLTITGTGDTPDYSDGAPWYEDRAEITAVVIEEGITSIGRLLFRECSNCETVEIPEGVTKINEAAFYCCYQLKGAALPTSLKTIGRGAFCDCYAFSELTAPCVETIEDYAFQNVALRAFTLPKTLTNLSSLAFWDAGLKSYSVEEGNPVYSASDGILFTDGGATLVSCPSGCEIVSYDVPDGTVKIEENAFINNRYIKEIDLEP